MVPDIDNTSSFGNPVPSQSLKEKTTKIFNNFTKLPKHHKFLAILMVLMASSVFLFVIALASQSSTRSRAMVVVTPPTPPTTSPLPSDTPTPTSIVSPTPPLGIFLEEFFAKWLDIRRVRINWTTSNEINNRGFNIWRGNNPKAPSVRINTNLIPSCSPGGNQGCSYYFIDLIPLALGTKTRPTYYYWLENIDLDGTVTRHGPVLAQQPASDN